MMSGSKETGTDAEHDKDIQLDKGDRMALKTLLEKRLNDCGWRKDIQQIIRNTLNERGVSNITHDELAAEIVPMARSLVPDVIRKEMLTRVREALGTQLSSVDK